MVIIEPIPLWGRQDISRERMYSLIDAAPELLALLKECEELLSQPSRGHDGESCFVDEIRAAIAKAEGGK